jgi:hypothetical protein
MGTKRHSYHAYVRCAAENGDIDHFLIAHIAQLFNSYYSYLCSVNLMYHK